MRGRTKGQHTVCLSVRCIQDSENHLISPPTSISCSSPHYHLSLGQALSSFACMGASASLISPYPDLPHPNDPSHQRLDLPKRCTDYFTLLLSTFLQLPTALRINSKILSLALVRPSLTWPLSSSAVTLSSCQHLSGPGSRHNEFLIVS